MVDRETARRLESAADVDAINEILDGSAVRWSYRAPCLRHPENLQGCKLPIQVDIDPLSRIAIDCLDHIDHSLHKCRPLNGTSL